MLIVLYIRELKRVVAISQIQELYLPFIRKRETLGKIVVIGTGALILKYTMMTS